MPEFYEGGACRYQPAAQPYLDAIARGIRDKSTSRNFLLQQTEYAQAYAAAEPLWQDQWAQRDPTNSLKCPFWANYWYNPCSSCNCRVNSSVSMEIDSIFFLRKADGDKIAIHIEMKRDGEGLSLGQAEAYRPRAACYRDQRRARPGILPHHHFVTVLFHGTKTDIPLVKQQFDRVISHERARYMFPGYPA